jgi:proteasome accessory factor B
MFRLSRIHGKVTKVGRPRSYDVPDGLDLRAVSRRLGPGPRTEEAMLLVRTGAGAALRRTASVMEEGVTGPDGTTGWDRLRVTVSSLRWLADEVLAHGTAVVAEAPPALVDGVVGRLDALLSAGAPR